MKLHPNVLLARYVTRSCGSSATRRLPALDLTPTLCGSILGTTGSVAGDSPRPRTNVSVDEDFERAVLSEDHAMTPTARIMIPALVWVTLASIAPTPVAFSLLSSRWPPGEIVMEIQLGSASGLIDGSASWDACGLDALDEWNENLGGTGVSLSAVLDSTQTPASGDSINSVVFSDDIFGTPFGEQVLSVTLGSSLLMPGLDTTAETDVLFNTASRFNCYRGARRLSPVPESTNTFDLRRVALHEFGHVLGLGHPDQATPPQTVTAIMNAFIEDTDSLQPDDIQGVAALYAIAGTGRCFPPGSQVLSFFSCRENAYLDPRLLERTTQGFVDPGGAAVWLQEWLRYVANGCSGTEATTRVLLHIEGQGIQPVCRVVAPGAISVPPLGESLEFLRVLDAHVRDTTELHRPRR